MNPPPPPTDFAHWQQQRLAQTEQALAQWVGAGAPADLAAAMRYAVLGGGKRLRPLLVWAAAEAIGAQDPAAMHAALRAGCAVELIHAYSLAHDDMPCMDNDVLRRGQPTLHVRFGEATALLAGDALQALAFELLTPGAQEEDHAAASIPPAIQARLCRLLARAAGARGMAGGQAIDLASVGQTLTLAQLATMHQRKTGALLQASILMGAACHAHISPQAAPRAWQALENCGQALGLAFQVVDDILDVVADSATLGKTAGKDALHAKPTYVSLLGLEQARMHARRLHAQALEALAHSGLNHTAALTALADALVRRTY